MTDEQRARELAEQIQLLILCGGDCVTHVAALLLPLVRDQGRYRWLREHTDNMSLVPPLTVAKVTGYGLAAWSGDDLNAAIDAAIRGSANG